MGSLISQVSRDELKDALDIPDDIEIVDIRLNFRTRDIEIVFSSDRIPAHQPGADLLYKNLQEVTRSTGVIS